jgi:hypothetical protein
MWRNMTCVALVAAGITAALFSICAAGIALAPPASTVVLDDLLHLELGSLPQTVTPGRFVALFAGWSLGAGLVAAFIAWLCTGAFHGTSTQPVRFGGKPTTKVLQHV